MTEEQQPAPPSSPSSPSSLAKAVEMALVQGDLKSLTAEQRLVHYQRVCESLGLNPHTQPFAYLNLNQKLILYATKGCCDQLRATRGVTVTGVKNDVADDILTVTVEVRDRDGRQDMDVGCVSLKGLSGDALANARMKALTKAKRRATLSLCGLGFLDESELDTIPPERIVAAPPRLSAPQAAQTTEANTNLRQYTTTEPPPPAPPPPVPLPQNGLELLDRLNAFEDRLVEESLCAKGDLLACIRTLGQRKRFPDNIGDWRGGQLGAAVEESKDFAKLCKKQRHEAESKARSVGKQKPAEQTEPQPVG